MWIQFLDLRKRCAKREEKKNGNSGEIFKGIGES